MTITICGKTMPREELFIVFMHRDDVINPSCVLQFTYVTA